MQHLQAAGEPGADARGADLQPRRHGVDDVHARQMQVRRLAREEPFQRRLDVLGARERPADVLDRVSDEDDALSEPVLWDRIDGLLDVRAHVADERGEVACGTLLEHASEGGIGAETRLDANRPERADDLLELHAVLHEVRQPRPVALMRRAARQHVRRVELVAQRTGDHDDELTDVDRRRRAEVVEDVEQQDEVARSVRSRRRRRSSVLLPAPRNPDSSWALLFDGAHSMLRFSSSTGSSRSNAGSS